MSAPRSPATIRKRRRFATIAAAGIVAACVMPTPSIARAAPTTGDEGSVTRWAERHAIPIRNLERPGPDLARLRRATRHAQIVGLGEQGHRLAEVTALKRRALEFLIEKRGFRSLAWEGDWSLGTMVNDYIHGRRDNRDELVAQMSIGRSREVADLLSWLREYNRSHREQVDFVGVEYFATRHLAYDAVKSYVAEHEQGKLPEVERLFKLIYPRFDNIGEHLDWYMHDVDDKQPYVRAGRELHDLVASVRHRPDDRRHAIVMHHARQIRSWYTAFAQPEDEIPAFRDARAAENLRWWQRFSGDKVIYWAATAHTAAVPDMEITAPPPFPASRFASVGSFLDEWYGKRYVTIGYTFDRGTMLSDADEPVSVPPAADDWFGVPLGDVDEQQFLLDLDRPMPDAVREWLDAPMLTRGYPALGYASTASGSTPADWYDVIVHRQVVSPVTPQS